MSRRSLAKENSAHRIPTRVSYLQLLPQRRDRWAFALAALLAAVIFSNGLTGELVFDDLLAIQKNKDSAANGTPLWDIFFHDFWGHHLTDVSSNASYRPLCILTFRLQHLLMGFRHVPVFLHAFNFTLALLNSFLVYYVARLYNRLILGRREDEDTPKGGRGTAEALLRTYGVPTLAMLLFLAHPVHVDCVTSIVGRCELLSAFFGLLAFFCVHSTLTPVPVSTTPSRQSACGQRQWRLTAQQQGTILLACLFMICSVLCKDSGITFFGIFVAHAMFLLWHGECTRHHALVLTAMSMALLVLYFKFRAAFVGVVDLRTSPLLRRTENPQYFIPPGIWHWLGLRWVIQMKNLELLFWPTKLCCEYNYNCIPHLGTLSDPRVPTFTAVTVFLLLTVIVTVYYAVCRRSRLAATLLVACMWVAIPYAPVSHLFVSVGTYVAERCLYTPSIGSVLLITFLTFYACPRQPRVAAILLVGIILYWSFISHKRNIAWESNKNLFQAAVDVCPNSGKSHYQLGNVLTTEAGVVTPAIASLFYRAYELDPEYKESLFYIGAYEWEAGNLTQGYQRLRECTADPFSLSLCYPVMEKMRKALFPRMKPHEILLDHGDLMQLRGLKAGMYRKAALMLSNSEHLPCEATDTFQEALRLWEEAELYWQSDEAGREPSDDNYCNALYHWALSFAQCYLVPSDDDDDTVRALDAKAVKDVALQIRGGARLCQTQWADRETLKAKLHVSKTYPMRMNGYFQTIDQLVKIISMLSSNPATAAGNEKLLLITSTEILLRQYCDTHTLLENSELHRTFSQVAANINTVRSGFGIRRVPLISTISSSLKVLRTVTDAFDDLSNIRDLLQCSSTFKNEVV